MGPIATVLLSLGGLGLFLIAWGVAARKRRKARGVPAAETGSGAGTESAPGFEAVARRVEGRMAALEARLDGGSGGGSGAEERLQAMAAQLLGLIRDKNATLETALAGLDQLRARMKTLEQMGPAAEARGLFEGIVSRLDGLERAQAAAAAALEAGLAARRAEAEGPDPQLALVEQLTKLHAQKDGALAAVIARLAPLEGRLGAGESDLGGRAPARAEMSRDLARVESRLEARIEAVAAAQVATGTALAALEAAGSPVAELAQGLARLHAQKDAMVESLTGRIAALETELAARDPRTALDGFAARLEALQSRLDAPAENPFAEISEQLTRLYAQKDATTEAVLARLAPLEAQLATLQGELALRDPKAALDGFAVRLDALQARLDAPGENPFAEISEQLTRLYAQKDATTETVLARLAPLEAKLAGLEARDPRAAFDGFAARLDTLQARLDAPGEDPFVEISEQLTLLHAQRDAGLAALEARLAAMEARPDGEAAAEAAARAEARAIADQLAALRAAAAQTELFADRLAVLEASLPRLNAAQSQMMRALERQAAATSPASPAPGPGAAEAAAVDPLALNGLPRVISLHQK